MINNDEYSLPPSLYKLDKVDKESLCAFLYGVKMPDGFPQYKKMC